jgi:hypothetical protein
MAKRDSDRDRNPRSAASQRRQQALSEFRSAAGLPEPEPVEETDDSGQSVFVGSRRQNVTEGERRVLRYLLKVKRLKALVATIPPIKGCDARGIETTDEVLALMRQSLRASSQPAKQAKFRGRPSTRQPLAGPAVTPSWQPEPEPVEPSEPDGREQHVGGTTNGRVGLYIVKSERETYHNVGRGIDSPRLDRG